jgi:acetoin utilization protein AcuC
LLVDRYDDQLGILQPRMATIEELSLVHEASYLTSVTEDYLCSEWSGHRGDLAKLAQKFAGGTLVALDALLDGSTLTAIHLPGAKHHAQYDRSSGFCVFADFAIAAKVAVAKGLKVAILDVDAHHGDGTENLCLDDPNIMTFSVHEAGIFPGTGLGDQPEMHAYNEPLVRGDGDNELFKAVARFCTLAREFAPDLIFVAAGADGHNLDPLAHLNYETGGMYLAIGNLRSSFPSMPMLMGGAGGYQPDKWTPRMWESAAQALVDGAELPHG